MENHSNNLLENKWIFLFISLVYLSIITRSDSIGWIIAPFYLIILATYLNKSRGYGYNFYIILSLLSIVLECLLLAYVYLFDHIFLKVPLNLAWFLGTVVLTLLLILLYARFIITGELKNSINKPSKNKNAIHFNKRHLKQMKEGNLVIILTFISSVLIFFINILISPNIHYFVIGLILAMVLFMVGLMLVFMKIFRLLRSAGFKI